MRRTLKIKSLQATALHRNGIPRCAIRIDDPVEDPDATALAKVTLHGVAFLGRARPHPQLGAEVVRWGPEVGSWEDGRAAEGRPGLLLAFGAVADVTGGGVGERCWKGDGAALAFDFGVGSGR